MGQATYYLQFTIFDLSGTSFVGLTIGHFFVPIGVNSWRETSRVRMGSEAAPSYKSIHCSFDSVSFVVFVVMILGRAAGGLNKKSPLFFARGLESIVFGRSRPVVLSMSRLAMYVNLPSPDDPRQ